MNRLVSELHSKMARAQRQLLTVRDLTFSAARESCLADKMVVKLARIIWELYHLKTCTH